MCTDALPGTPAPSQALGLIPALGAALSEPQQSISGTQIKHKHSDEPFMQEHDDITSPQPIQSRSLSMDKFTQRQMADSNQSRSRSKS
jgi:hypothetical protein